MADRQRQKCRTLQLAEGYIAMEPLGPVSVVKGIVHDIAMVSGVVRSPLVLEVHPSTESRSDQLPNIPTLGAFLPGFEASAFVAIGAPNDTPTEIIGRLNHEINAGQPIPRSRRGSPNSAARRWWARPPSSTRSSPTKPRSGPR
jgi:hypothetical protein